MKVVIILLFLLLIPLQFCDIKIYEDQTTRLLHETIQLTDNTGDHHHPARSPDGSISDESILKSSLHHILDSGVLTSLC